nr:hypothetical protein CPGR_00800 [Mycolicibacterium fortuitum subsp. fortuitum DSM 46621 = ATCC 6841 = JCM 6387]
MSSTMPCILPTMLFMTSRICSMSAIILSIVSMVICISSACLSMSAIRSCMYF